jgi:hypothetical protein
MIILSSFLLIACQQAENTESTTHSQKEGTENAHHEGEHHDGHHPEEQVVPEPTKTDEYTDFGTPLTHETLTEAKDFLTTPQDFVGKTVRVSGTAADVCQKAGCWIVLSDGDKTMRVTSKDHGFFVDKQGAGRNCEVEGVVISRQKDASRTAHFESEAGEGAPIPENEVEGETYYEIEATGIRLYNTTL